MQTTAEQGSNGCCNVAGGTFDRDALLGGGIFGDYANDCCFFLKMVIPSVGPKSIMTMMLGGLIVVVLRHAYLKVIGPV